MDEALAFAREAQTLHLECMVADGEALPVPSTFEAIMAQPENRDALAALVSAPAVKSLVVGNHNVSDEDARDTALADVVAADLATGRQERLPAAMVDRLIAGEPPIRVWREHRDLSQAQLAAATGLNLECISELESGHKGQYLLEALTKIARALRCRLDDLVLESD